MVGYISCGMYIILERVYDRSYPSMKCGPKVLMAGNIQGLAMQLETMMEFRQRLEGVIQVRREEVIQTTQDLQTLAGVKRTRLPEEEGDPWKNMITRTRQRKILASDG